MGLGLRRDCRVRFCFSIVLLWWALGAGSTAGAATLHCASLLEKLRAPFSYLHNSYLIGKTQKLLKIIPDWSDLKAQQKLSRKALVLEDKLWLRSPKDPRIESLLPSVRALIDPGGTANELIQSLKLIDDFALYQPRRKRSDRQSLAEILQAIATTPVQGPIDEVAAAVTRSFRLFIQNEYQFETAREYFFCLQALADRLYERHRLKVENPSSTLDELKDTTHLLRGVFVFLSESDAKIVIPLFSEVFLSQPSDAMISDLASDKIEKKAIARWAVAQWFMPLETLHESKELRITSESLDSIYINRMAEILPSHDNIDIPLQNPEPIESLNSDMLDAPAPKRFYKRVTSPTAHNLLIWIKSGDVFKVRNCFWPLLSDPLYTMRWGKVEFDQVHAMLEHLPAEYHTAMDVELVHLFSHSLDLAIPHP